MLRIRVSVSNNPDITCYNDVGTFIFMLEELRS